MSGRKGPKMLKNPRWISGLIYALQANRVTSPPDNQDTPPAKASLWALSPLLVFFLLYLVISIAVQDFYAVPVLSLIHI